MTLLQFFFIVSWFTLLLISLDIARKQRFNAIHFLVFIWVWVWLLLFSIFPKVLDKVWIIFWVARWADVLVYWAIIFLLYFVLLLLSKHVNNKDSITDIIRELAISNSDKKVISWKYVVLIRAYNEWKVVKNVLQELLDFWHENILIVNDWSKDDTKKILSDFWDKIHLLNHMINRWAWAALETWFEYLRRYSECDYIITFDADWQHDFKDIEKFVNEFEKNKNLDVVFWSRFLEKSKTNIPFFRKIVLLLWKFFTLIISRIYLSDPHNWFRWFTFDSIKNIKLTIENMAYASELVDQIKYNKLTIKEIPVNIKYTDYSLSKWQKSSNAINIALRIIWSKFFR